MIKPLTGVRGFAAAWVVFYHFRLPIDALIPTWETVRLIVWSGFLGVDLFAVLSGFVISLTYQSRLSEPSLSGTARFLWLRLARIYPLHLFVLALFVVCSLWRTWPTGGAEIWGDSSLWLQAAMLNGWGLEDRLAWNVPSWTVSSEWLCYLLFPVAVPLLARVESGRACALLAAVTMLATIGLMRAVGHPYFGAILDYGFLRIGGEFLTGCWLYRSFRAGYGRNLPWGWIGAAALGVGLYSTTIRQQPISVASFAVLVYALAQDRQPLTGAFGNRVSVYLGEISYSVYLIHWFVLAEVQRMLHVPLSELSPLWATALLIGLVFALASITYFTVERPARRSLRRLVGAERGTEGSPSHGAVSRVRREP